MVSCYSKASEVFLCLNLSRLSNYFTQSALTSVSACCEQRFHVLTEGPAALRLCQHPTLVPINQKKPQLNRINDSTEKLRTGSLMCKQAVKTRHTAAESSLTPRSWGWRNAHVNQWEIGGN